MLTSPHHRHVDLGAAKLETLRRKLRLRRRRPSNRASLAARR
ncbi:MAG TPA: hypothetical protein VHV52_12245 [Gaiellaceae bacterium]|jgi:hypothetical protein|nr:hypothetical protein [Gaiellaceae bacterium]